MYTELVTMSQDLPVKLEDLKGHLRLQGNDFDDILSLHLAAAVEAAEAYTGLVLRDSTYKTVGIPETDVVCTDILPVREITSVTVDGHDVKDARIYDSKILVPGAAGKQVEVTFAAGYTQLPYDIVAAILLIAARFFEHPVDGVEQLPKASTNLLRAHKRWGR